jgi:hypothetical protein
MNCDVCGISVKYYLVSGLAVLFCEAGVSGDPAPVKFNDYIGRHQSPSRRMGKHQSVLLLERSPLL